MTTLRTPPQGVGRVAVVGIIAGVAICLFAGVFTWMVAEPAFSLSDELDVALRQLVKGDTATAVAIADKIDPRKLKDDADLAKQELILGVDAWERSERAFEQKVIIERAQEAEEHLLEAKKLGFPKGYEGLGNYALGMTIARIRNSVDAVEPLRESTKKWPIGRSRALETIIETLLAQDPPDLEHTHEELDRWSALPDLDENDFQQTRLAKAKLLAKEQHWDEAYEIARTIPADTPAYIGSRILMSDIILSQAASLDEATRAEKLEDALTMLKEISKSPDINISDHRVALYLQGVVLRKQGKLTEAERSFFNVRQSFPETPEAMAAAIEEIELIVQQDRPDDATSVVSYLSNHYGKPEWYTSPRFRIEEYRNKLVGAGRGLIRNRHFESAQLFGRELPIVCTDADRHRVQAEAYRAQGLMILDRAQKEIGLESAKIAEEALEPMELAGQHFAKLSSLQMLDSEYFDLLWNAIDSFRTARNWNESLKLLERYMDLVEKAKQPRGLLAQSNIYLATKQNDKAIFRLRQLLNNYDDDPLIYQARILLSQALSEKSEFDEATQLLLQNLNDGHLTPESLHWHDSLYHLGELHFRRGQILQLEAKEMPKEKFTDRITKLAECDDQLRESIRRNEFAIQKFPKDPRNLRAQYAVAQAYRMRAYLPQTYLNEDRLLAEDKRRVYVLQRKDMYEGAVKWYTNLRNEINERQDALQLDEYTASLFRNCYFGIADLKFELQEYEEALQAYRLIVNRYSNEPEALEAIVQTVRCYEKLEKPQLIRPAINNALLTLNRIPPDKDPMFTKVTSRDRAGWNTYLNWLLKNA